LNSCLIHKLGKVGVGWSPKTTGRSGIALRHGLHGKRRQNNPKGFSSLLLMIGAECVRTEKLDADLVRAEWKHKACESRPLILLWTLPIPTQARSPPQRDTEADDSCGELVPDVLNGNQTVISNADATESFEAAVSTLDYQSYPSGASGVIRSAVGDDWLDAL
jgi:hypothetical protein